METTMITPGIDHIALNVPDLDAQIERLTTAMGSDDDQVHFRHFGFRADDVDSAHQQLVETGMETTEEPHRRDFAAMYTSFLQEQGCVDVQLVNYDRPAEPDIPVGPTPHDAFGSTRDRG